MIRTLALLAGLALAFAPLVFALGPEEETSKEGSEKVEFDLETIFDEDGLFGPSARSLTISEDGAYGAYLYRPYDERRHGSDLWLVDLKTGETKRVTSVSAFAPFQKRTRKVGKLRIAAAKKRAKEESKGDDSTEEEADAKGADTRGDETGGRSWSDLKKKADAGAKDDASEEEGSEEEDDSTEEFTEEELRMMDVVGEDDADDEDAPRYGGVSSYTWAPDANEMLVSGGGDVYRFVVGADEGLVRLTKTRQSERNVQYLPDGSGYTALIGDALVRVRFGDHFVDQLDPRLPDGMSMRSYRLSPDGERVVFLASNSERRSGAGRTVDIATYRDRFMKVRTVPRTVSDDPIRATRTAVFLYGLPKPDAENGELIRVYERKSSGPRDVLRLPDWAPDSSRVTFAVFEQSSEEVHVMEAEFEHEQEEEGEKERPKKGDDDQDHVVRDAKVVHRFLHTGGPNTPRMIEPMYLADSRRIALLTEQTGFRHLHVLDPVYEALEPLTRGHFEVYPIGMPTDRSCVFVEATREDSACLDVYRVDLESGEMTRLTTNRGQYSGAAICPKGEHVLATFSAYGSPRELVHVDATKGEQRALTDSHPESTKTLVSASPSFFAFENRHGQTIHGHMFEPEREEGEKRPLLIYVYGGPLGTRKQVTEGNFGSDGYFFANYMTRTHGWVTCTIDPRGMSGYGALFEKANFEQVGVPQVEDLADGVAHLIEHHDVDPERVAIHGWSFGGFQTQMCMYTEPDVFKCGIAGAGPTEWENYNSWYSTGTIGDSREGKTDLDKYSLLPLAKNLEGKLLLVHGMEDANVLYQDTVRVYAELLDAGKETLVELFVDPTGGHGLGGHVKRLGRFRKYEEFLLRAMP
ncbi:MAG: prolyl oligopeptidase family serine peptidase [Planctomycetota bacterium]